MTDHSRLEFLVNTYEDTLYRAALAILGDVCEAEDAVQDAFLRCWEKAPEFDSPEHAKAWLLRVASNCANDLFRLPWRRREEPLDENLSAPERPEEGSVTQAVLSLPARYRIPIHLYYYEGYSVAEIANILGRSEGTVKSRLFRARDLLRNQLREEEDGGQIQV